MQDLLGPSENPPRWGFERVFFVVCVLLLGWSIYLAVNSGRSMVRDAPGVLLPSVLVLLTGRALIEHHHPRLSRWLGIAAWVLLAATLSIQFGILDR